MADVVVSQRTLYQPRVVIRLALLVVVVLASLLQLGTTGRHSSLGHLLSDLQAGRTHAVVVLDDRVLWRTEDGLLPQRVDLGEARREQLPLPERFVEYSGNVWDAAGLRELLAHYPGIPHDAVRTAPGWLDSHALLGVAAVLALLLLLSGPQPWHVNRWGWFWLLGVGSREGLGLGLAAYLLLSGPLPWRQREEPAVRRTGGAGFVWGVMLGTAASFLGFALQQLLLPDVLGPWRVRTTA